jgi:hypothetical protein
MELITTAIVSTASLKRSSICVCRRTRTFSLYVIAAPRKTDASGSRAFRNVMVGLSQPTNVKPGPGMRVRVVAPAYMPACSAMDWAAQTASLWEALWSRLQWSSTSVTFGASRRRWGVLAIARTGSNGSRMSTIRTSRSIAWSTRAVPGLLNSASSLTATPLRAACAAISPP